MTEEKEKTKPGVSRREFIAGTVGGVVVGAVVGAAAGSLGFPKTITKTNTTTQTATQTTTQTATQITTLTTTSTTTAQPWLPSKWDQTTDVVVLGTGLAGLSAAIAAYDAGAKVLLLEKLDQAHEGGNSRISYNGFYTPKDVVGGAAYIQAMEMGTVTDPSLYTFQAQGLIDNVAWVQKLGGNIGVLTTGGNAALPNAADVTMYGAIAPGQTKAAAGGGYLWQTFRDAVTKRGITVLYNTPGTDLIQNSNTKEILGVKATSGGATVNIKASKGVVLACGGRENNQEMWAQMVGVRGIYGIGSPGNTGDGIVMAQKAGADMWHMGNQLGGNPAGIVVKDYNYPITNLTGISPAANNYIWVNKKGSRYVNEKGAIAGINMAVSSSSGTFLSVPAWLVFDDTTRAAGPLLSTTIQSGWFIWYSGWTWSKDNTAEIAKGWITKANTITDLANSIASDPDDLGPLGQPLMTATALQATITRWNGFVTAGADADYNRAASTLAAIQTAPFYAIKLWPCVAATDGGPRKNTKCQVLDPNLNRIPRLYSAGELGDFQGPISQGGGHLGECMFTGRTAGTNAAAETPWS